MGVTRKANSIEPDDCTETTEINATSHNAYFATFPQ